MLLRKACVRSCNSKLHFSRNKDRNKVITYTGCNAERVWGLTYNTARAVREPFPYSSCCKTLHGNPWVVRGDESAANPERWRCGRCAVLPPGGPAVRCRLCLEGAGAALRWSVLKRISYKMSCTRSSSCYCFRSADKPVLKEANASLQLYPSILILVPSDLIFSIIVQLSRNRG